MKYERALQTPQPGISCENKRKLITKVDGIKLKHIISTLKN
jgi:hypothetical protein